MNANKLLIANRGEIAIRIINAAFDLGIETLSIYSEDDANALHTIKSDQAIALKGKGARAYLDIDQILSIAKNTGCNLIHPGYGFLSENAEFAKRCAEEGILFVGPSADTIGLFGNKIKARQLAQRTGVPIIPGTMNACTLEEATAFFRSLPPDSKVMLKAMAGGGGRGMRLVPSPEDLEEAYTRCRSEAEKAFGQADVYVEKYLAQARHIEIQIIGDGSAVSHLWERECSIQRRSQKLIEIAPCPGLSEGLRQRIIEAALRLATAVNFENAGTFEFLMEGVALNEEAHFYFIEANPRIQVEHTVTEEVTGIDLVKFQLKQSLGFSLKDLQLEQAQIPVPEGMAMQCRINTESIDSQGNTILKTGKLSSFQMPFGQGVRIESSGYSGYSNNTNFDALLAKLIVHSRKNDFESTIKKMYRSLCECQIEGIGTNISFLQNILKAPAFFNNQFHTRFLAENLDLLISGDQKVHQKYFFENKLKEQTNKRIEEQAPVGIVPVRTPMPGSVVSVEVKEGESIQAGQQLLVLEAMKMESVVNAEVNGIIKKILVEKGTVLLEDQILFHLEISGESKLKALSSRTIDLDRIRPELAELQERKAFLLDESRPEKLAKRKNKGKQTARENIGQLCDLDSFIEYGSFIVAGRRVHEKMQDLIRKTPADGIITGIGAVNGNLFDEATAKCMILCYDYMVLAGTQGMFGHKKTDRVLELAYKSKLPLIVFAEGGGGRPGDTDFQYQGVGGLNVKTFAAFARHNGIAPRIAIVSGYCFAGNAALAGCADVIIATEDTSIGMGGPAMIEGGGLGKFHPTEVGPVSFQSKNGVLDIVVKDEAEAIITAKKYLSYFQGDLSAWECEDQRKLRHLIPENRRRVYDIRELIRSLADKDSVLELRKDYAIGMITAFIRIEGKPIGLIANNPRHLGGAIDAEGSGKAARFIQLCNVFGIPILSLCDTPGFMVGPDAEKTALVRRSARLFTIGAKARIPFFTVILRKAYGLGSQGMAAGGFHEPFFTVSWPTGEFGAMGLEGAVKLGFRKQLEAIEDPKAREALYQKMVADSYKHGKAINTASFLEIDEVIDPADTRKWVLNGLLSNPKEKYIDTRNRGFVDTW